MKMKIYKLANELGGTIDSFYPLPEHGAVSKASGWWCPSKVSWQAVEVPDASELDGAQNHLANLRTADGNRYSAKQVRRHAENGENGFSFVN